MSADPPELSAVHGVEKCTKLVQEIAGRRQLCASYNHLTVSVRAFIPSLAVETPRNARVFLRGDGPRLAQVLERPRSGWTDNLRAIFSGGRAPKKFDGGEHFRDCHVGRKTPAGSLAWSVLWHIVFAALLIQFGRFVWQLPKTSAFDDVRVVWSGPIEDLPLISPRPETKKPQPVARQTPQAPEPATPERGADAFHPTQTIVSAPKVVTHPTQTLVRPDLPAEAPKILPPLPNVVESEPEKPKLQITKEELQRMKPNEPSSRQVATAAVPELPNQERPAADVNFAAAPIADPKNPLFLSTGSSGVQAPKKVERATEGSSALPTIEGASGKQQLIALSATPSPAGPEAPVPAGNLAAKLTISPDGPRAGEPAGGTKSSGAGNGPAGISITGGKPKGSSGISGLGGAAGTSPRNLHLAPGEGGTSREKSAPPPELPMARLQPGSPPEHLFGLRKIYTLRVNTPNVSSASGSWVMSFAEMDDDPKSLHPPRTGEMTLPDPMRKVDPRYPPELVEQKIEGEVVLYAIIREDGSVDSIQLVRGVDPTLDKNSMEALAQWKFTPAKRGDEKVAVEAIVHIPFKAANRER